MRGNRQAGLFVLLSFFVGAACTHPQAATTPPPRSSTLRPIAPGWVSEVQTFSETHPYTSLVALERRIYAGTAAGLIRFDKVSGEHVRLTKAQGLPGNHIYSLAADPPTLWVATEGGISRLRDEAWTNIESAAGNAQAPTAMIALGGGLWVGDSRGLRHYQQGKWKRELPGAKVTTLLPDRVSQGIWVGTDGEGIYQLADGKFHAHSLLQGQVLRKVSRMTVSDSGALLAVGESDDGPRLTFFDGRHWTTYTPQPAGRLPWIKQVGDQLLLAYQDRVLALERVPAHAGKDAPPEGAIGLIPSAPLKAPRNYPLVRLVTRPVEHWFPPEPTAVAEDQQRVLLGTRFQGAAAYDGKEITWYRTRDLVGSAEKLKIACHEQVCYLAGGHGQAYRFQRALFQPVQVDQDPAARALAFVKSPAGQILSIVGVGNSRTLAVNALQEQRWSRQFSVEVTAPGKIDVRFVRFSPSGQMWVGLSYLDERSDSRPWGVMVLEPGRSPLYHRDSMLPTEDRQPGSLALPDDVRDLAFIGDELWLATTSGVCRVRGSAVELFTENDNLASELVYQTAASPEGEVLVTTLAGLGRLQNKQWIFERSGPLAGPTRALLVQGGTLWVGTELGLARVESGEIKLLETRHGLAGGSVLDLFLEDDRRLWVLTTQGLSLVTL